MAMDIQTQEQKYINPTTGAIVGGLLAGSAASYATGIPGTLMCKQMIKKMQKLGNSLTADEFSKVETAVAKTIKSSGLEAKGVTLIKATADNAKEVEEMIRSDFNNSILKYLAEKPREKRIKATVSQLLKGENAFYSFASKKIYIPEKGTRLTIFHELGHAINANLSKAGKFLQNCRFLATLSIPISIIALWKTKKAPDEKPKNNIDKATTFIKNNAGKLTFISLLPTVFEEGLASLRGNKFAKELLSPELAKKVAKSNALGLTTYLLLATFSGLGIYIGTKVKDNIACRKSITENK